MSLIASVLCAQFNQKKNLWERNTTTFLCTQTEKAFFLMSGAK